MLSLSPMALLFLAGNACVLPFWAAMLLPPRAAWAPRLLRSPWICAPFAAVYLALFVASAGALTALARAPSFEAIMRMIGSPLGTNLAWFHYLTGDLFIGRWIYWDSRGRDVKRPWLVVVFVLGLTFCPLSLLLYLVLRGPEPSPAMGQANV